MKEATSGEMGRTIIKLLNITGHAPIKERRQVEGGLCKYFNDYASSR
ncbi:MAG: hypothetical protein WCI04_01305 [archaeon]